MPHGELIKNRCCYLTKRGNVVLKNFPLAVSHYLPSSLSTRLFITPVLYET